MVTSKKIKNEIQVIQNKCLKTIMNLPLCTSTKLIHQTLKIDKINNRLGLLTCNYITKAKENNKAIIQIVNDHTIKPINYKRLKRSILDRINMQTLTPIPTTLN